MGNWEHYSHDADIGVRGVGVTREEAFEQVALALTAVIINPSIVARKDVITISCSGSDDELLLADWLNAIIYEMATRRMLFGLYEVHIRNGELTAQAWGEPVDVKRHCPVVEVKGATYTTLCVQKRNDHWIAQTVVDI
ncbi:MAG: archease [Gammaproteobacteria bacterium]|nr:archease [Gammaproteobacteria bacterium]